MEVKKKKDFSVPGLSIMYYTFYLTFLPENVKT